MSHPAIFSAPIYVNADAPKNSEAFRDKKRLIVAFCWTLIKERLLPLMRWCTSFVKCRMVLACYQADLAELWSILHIRTNGTYSDIKYLVPKKDFASFEKFASTESLADKKRTEEQALQVQISLPSRLQSMRTSCALHGLHL